MEEKERYEQYGYGTIVDNEVDLEDYEHSRLYMSDVINLLNQQDKQKPQCCDWDEYRNCKGYFKYHDIYELIIEEYEVEDE